MLLSLSITGTVAAFLKVGTCILTLPLVCPPLETTKYDTSPLGASVTANDSP